MLDGLRDAAQRNENQNWLKTALTELNDHMRDEQELHPLLTETISFLSRRLGASCAALYLSEENQSLRLAAAYAYTRRKHIANSFALGEGLVGQCALEKKPILLERPPHDYIHVTSSLGDAPPRQIIVLPLLYENEIQGVAELAALREFTPTQLEFLYQADYNSAIMEASLRENIVFADHNLVTDGVFGEMDLIVCRNVLIYFTRPLQNRVLELFSNSLGTDGFLCIGSKETIQFSSIAQDFEAFIKEEKIYRKKSAPAP